VSEVSIWNEVMNSKTISIDEETQTLRASTLNHLIILITSAAPAQPNSGPNPDQWAEIFLTTFPIFTTPDQIISKLIQR
jgi:hypothetical protein